MMSYIIRFIFDGRNLGEGAFWEGLLLLAREWSFTGILRGYLPLWRDIGYGVEERGLRGCGWIFLGNGKLGLDSE